MGLESAAMNSSNITQSQGFLTSLALTKKHPEQSDASIPEERDGIRTALSLLFFEKGSGLVEEISALCSIIPPVLASGI